MRKLFATAGHAIHDGEVVVPTVGSRTQRIEVSAPEDGLVRLSTRVTGPAAARAAGFGHRECWERNRLSELIGLRIGSRGEIVAESWMPVTGLTAELVGIHIHHLALGADRWEQQLTGEDAH
jgi:hypothetical protein